MKLQSLLPIAAVVVQVASGAAYAQSLDAPPAFDVGDKWTFQFTNKGDKKDPYTYTHQAYKVDSVSSLLFRETQQPNAQRPQSIGRFDYKRSDVVEAFEYQPTAPKEPGVRFGDWLNAESAFQFPLVVGNKYELKWPYANGGGYTEMNVKVEAFEKVTVPAGEFDAYRVKYDGWWYNQSGGMTSASGRASQTRWYAPAVKRVIKWETADKRGNGSPFNETITELVKWEPQAALPVPFKK